ncbi:Membrane coat complex Retromer, subunit VPS5/SNX1, Sorting nexins, and related PX domain-containing proteins [Phaffia rhodozyma]|uniref:Membrane coat complex Retromer, subunit VPS5/SNX1, Sorting nexins, and related PX domain-containing proteins n=1 Tax=Phaffia rhodozyma TaxID=264483 RepID=A0A0F7SKC6_PHARH|nr:Membrane coat complex Retromer, subunit VPS5/SNX1, Sorting nexins, and related PX domain-containing proteins [Phaffia rhodozyma]
MCSTTSHFEAATHRIPGNLHVLIITTGSVASVKLPLIVQALLKNENISVQVIATEASLTFFEPQEAEAVGKGVKVWRDRDEWATWNKIGDPILHIELRRWADLVLVAPCSANSLAKIAGGLCDNLATSVLRALEPSTPTYLFPAMNTHMYFHPLTAKHLRVVEQEIGYNVRGPVGKTLACGDIGLGAMLEWKDIVHLVEEHHLKTHSTSTTTPSETTRSQTGPSSQLPSLQDRLCSPLDTLISYSRSGQNQQPSPRRDPEVFDLEARHPLVLSAQAISELQSQLVLPPSLVHSPWRDKDGLRIFWFCPERLGARQLKALASALEQSTGQDAQGAISEGKDEEVEKSKTWTMDSSPQMGSSGTKPSRAPPAPPSSDLDRLNLDDTESKSVRKRTRPPIPTSSILHPSISSLPNHNASNAHVLTPLRAHYLKKFLVNHQFMDELALISDPALGMDGIAALGAPFKAPLEQVPGREEGIMRTKTLPDLPFLKFMFRQFVLTFPFLTAAPASFWPHKVQPTLSQFLALSLAPSSIPFLDDDPSIATDAAKRRQIFDRLEKHMTVLLGSAIKVEGGEEVVRIGQDDLHVLEEEAKRRVQLTGGVENKESPEFEINVIGVRGIAEKGRVRSKTHEEFLIRTRRTNRPDVYVWRRYGDFRRLSDELRLHHPKEEIRSPPAKDRTTVTTTSAQAPGNVPSAPQSTRAYLASWIPGASSSSTSSPRSSIDHNSSSVPGSPFDPTLSRTSTADSGLPPNLISSNLTREKNRLTLRSFLRSLLAKATLANSPVLRSFLLSQPVELSAGEQIDARRREDADRIREEGKKQFKREAERRVEELRSSIKELREEVIQTGGIRGVFEIIKQTEKKEDLPEDFQKVLEYGRISVAAAIFQTFVASDDASNTLSQLKRLHGLMPYFVLKGILKISNPMAMIRGVLDLFLARPFGGQSLIQRMFSTAINEDIRDLTEQIDVLSEKIGDPVFCEKVKQFVAAPPEIQKLYKMDADAEGIDILAVILRSPDAPALSRPQMMRVIQAHRAYSQYRSERVESADSDEDDGPEQEEGWLFVDLNYVMKLYSRVREREKMIALIFEGATAELMKDIITIFYAPLAQVYKAAGIADSLGDLQNFINDLIKTLDQVEDLSQENSSQTVQIFIDLVERHEQSFYTFVHKVHSKGSNLFSSFMSWIEIFLDFVRDGVPSKAAGGPGKIDLEVLLPHSGPERQALLKEVDDIAVYHYKLKVAHESKVRRKFLRAGGKSGGSGEAADGEEEQELIDSLVDGLSIGNTMRSDVQEIEEEDSSDDDVIYENDEESDEDADGAGNDGFSTPPEESTMPLQSPAVLLWDEKSPPILEAPASRSLRHPIRHKKSPSNSSTAIPTNSNGSSTTTSGNGAVSGLQRRMPPPGTPADGLYGKKETARHAKKKGKVTITPPSVRLLPDLLPLFIEMVRPLLIESKLEDPQTAK